MKSPFFESGRPLVFAHRGGAGLAPENTMAAFDEGLSRGADGLELDVRLSSDGVVVVHHDRTLDRTTNLRGPVSRVTAEALARADAAWHFRRGRELPLRGQGVAVPTLAAVLGRYPGVPIIIDMKENTAALAAAVVDVVRSHDAVERVCLGAIGRRVLRAARTLEPAVATSAGREEVRWALYRSWVRWPISAPRYDGFQVPERSGTTRVVSPRFIAAAHRAGLGVQVWTVDGADDAERLLAWGADALITDRPDIIVSVVRTRAGRVRLQADLRGGS